MPATRQYYYRQNDCNAKDLAAADCICWHDLGTGPFPEAKEGGGLPSNWRDKPRMPDAGPKAVPPVAPPMQDESRAVVIPNAPDEIWLNVGDLFEPTDGKFDFDGFSEGEVTWSAEKQDRDDIKYVRADIAAFRAVASNLAARLDSSIVGPSEAEKSDQPSAGPARYDYGYDDGLKPCSLGKFCLWVDYEKLATENAALRKNAERLAGGIQILAAYRRDHGCKHRDSFHYAMWHNDTTLEANERLVAGRFVPDEPQTTPYEWRSGKDRRTGIKPDGYRHGRSYDIDYYLRDPSRDTGGWSEDERKGAADRRAAIDAAMEAK